MSGTLGSIFVKIGADLTQFSTAMQSAERKMKTFGKDMKRVGEDLSKYVTLPLAALGAASLKSFADLEQLKLGLKAVAGSSEEANRQFEQLREIAKLPGLGVNEAVRGSINLQAIGMSADEAKTAMMAFGNAIGTIGGKRQNFDLAIRGFGQLVNASKPLQQDLYQIANQLPQVNKLMIDAFGTNRAEDLAALGMSGRDLADFLVTELGKLPKVTGGLANSFENMGDTVRLSLAQIGESIEKNFNISGKIGKIAGLIDRLATAFSKLSPTAQRVSIIIAGVAAAAGPLLWALGALTSTVIPAMIAGFRTFMFTIAPLVIKIGLIVAAVAALIVIVKTIIDVWGHLKTFFSNLFTTLGGIAARGILLIVKPIHEGISGLASIIGVTLDDGIVKKLERMALEGGKAAQQLNGDLKNIGTGVAESLNDTWSKVTGFFKGASDEAGSAGGGAGAEPTETPDFSGGAGGGKSGMDDYINFLATKLPEANQTAIKSNDDLANSLNDLGVKAAVPLDDLKGKIAENSAEWNKMQMTASSAMIYVADKALENGEKIKAIFIDMGQVMSEVMTVAIVSAAESLGETLAGVGNGIQGFGEGILKAVGAFMGQLGRALVASALAAEAFKKLLANPVAAAIAGVALIAASTVVVKTMEKGPTAFAEGGIISGPTLALMGEYPSAKRDPEVVSPLSKLQNMLDFNQGGGVSGNVVFRIEGDHLVGVLDNHSKLNRR